MSTYLAIEKEGLWSKHVALPRRADHLDFPLVPLLGHSLGERTTQKSGGGPA